MRLHDILLEMPAMVPQGMYPLEKSSVTDLEDATILGPSRYTLLFQDKNVRIVCPPHRPTDLYLFFDDTAIGVMSLARSRIEALTVPGWQVMNVFILPEYRNKKLGLMLYNYVLHHRKEAFASAAAMTPASRRVYTSLFKDPTVDVYAIVNKQRQEVVVGPDGISTEDPKDNNRAAFIAVAK